MKLPDIVWGKEVPAGRYMIGGDSDAYYSFHKREVWIRRPFRLSCYPITKAQFKCFIEATDWDDQQWWQGMPSNEQAFREPTFPHDNHPRETVSWYQAVAFCRWLSDKLSYRVVLPHEYEWEVAARYPDGRFYPWGNQFNTDNANTAEGNTRQTTAVGIYSSGKNHALDLYDLSGNVWEWCRNKYDNPDDEAVDKSGHRRVLRGGSWLNYRSYARAASRPHNHPGYLNPNFGFRLVRHSLSQK
jgi:formylglycine-generating enzyme required for sulfatase activity